MKTQDFSFYQARVLMNLEKLEKAKKIRWYLALLHIEEGNKSTAIELLKSNKTIVNSFKADETDELLLFLENSE